MSEHDWNEAKESNIHYFAGGHHATEQFGIQELLKKFMKSLATSLSIFIYHQIIQLNL